MWRCRRWRRRHKMKNTLFVLRPFIINQHGIRQAAPRGSAPFLPGYGEVNGPFLRVPSPAQPLLSRLSCRPSPVSLSLRCWSLLRRRSLRKHPRLREAKRSAAVRGGKERERKHARLYTWAQISRSVGRSSATLSPVLSFVAGWRLRAWVFQDMVMLDHLTHAASNRGRARPALHATRFVRARKHLRRRSQRMQLHDRKT